MSKKIEVSAEELRKLRNLLTSVLPEDTDEIDETFEVFLAYKKGNISGFPRYHRTKSGAAGFFCVPSKK